MRHFLLMQVLLFVCAAVSATPVSESQARQKALNFVSSKMSTHSGAMSIQSLPQLTRVEGVDNSAAYIYNIDGGGFVIVSGDSRMHDILAYNSSGSIDAQNMPPAMQWWLGKCKATATRLTQTNDVQQQLQVYTAIPTRMTTKWGQQEPYNTYTPRIYFNRDGQQYSVPSLTGCVATALAQVLNYYGYPASTQQKIKSYSDTSRVMVVEQGQEQNDTLYFNGEYKTEAIPANTPLNWDLIQNNDKDAIARLMEYCGAALNMDYSNIVSLSKNKHVLEALNNVFGYKDAYVLYADEYDSISKWVDRCYLELFYNGPFLIAGTNDDGGHQFVIDGYNSGYFYVNWGWDGRYDGYFLIDVLNPYNYLDISDAYEKVSIIAGMGANGKCHKDLIYQEMIFNNGFFSIDDDHYNHIYTRGKDGNFLIPVTWIGGTFRYLTTDYIPAINVCDEKNNVLFSIRLKDDGYIRGYFSENDSLSESILLNLNDGKYHLYSAYELTGSDETYFTADCTQHLVSIEVDGDRLLVNNSPDTDMEKHFNLFGDKKCFVMLVQFQDVKFSIPNPQEFFNRLCNEPGFTGSNDLYPTNAGRGSVRDYFSAQSDGVFNISFDVLPVVTVKHNQDYYGADDPYDPKSTDLKIGEMVTEALNAVDGSIDFNEYCWDDTKKEVTNFYIVTPGTSQSENPQYTTLLWPSRRHLNEKYVSGDGITLSNYAYGTELTGSLENDKGEYDPKLRVDGIGTMCHEFSHCLGFMDHYDTGPGRHGEVQAVGYFDVMGRGCTNGNEWVPAGYSGYERQQASWIDFKELLLNEPQIIENLYPINRGGDCYVVRNPLNYNEFFTIEVREKSGWDACLPDSGLMISYINYNKVRWEVNYVNVVGYHYKYPGVRILSPGLAIDSIYTVPERLYHEGDSLTDYTTPYAFIYTNNPYDYYGRDLHMSITDIVMNDDGSYSFNWMNCATPTVIQGVRERREQLPDDDAYYTLDGRRLNRKPRQGVFIHQGKKIYIR